MYAIDYIPELIALTTENIRKEDRDLLEENKVIPIAGDGWLGYEAGSPYDVIHVGAAAARMPVTLYMTERNTCIVRNMVHIILGVLETIEAIARPAESWR